MLGEHWGLIGECRGRMVERSGVKGRGPDTPEDETWTPHMADKIYGRADLRLDAKGRMILPAKFCPPFAPGQQVILARHQQLDPCLNIWTLDAFAKVEARMEGQQDEGDEEERYQARVWAADTERVALDNQRRLPIPAHLREIANLGDGPVIVTGSIDHLEVWDAATWAATVEARVASRRARSASSNESSNESSSGSSRPPTTTS